MAKTPTTRPPGGVVVPEDEPDAQGTVPDNNPPPVGDHPSTQTYSAEGDDEPDSPVIAANEPPPETPAPSEEDEEDPSETPAAAGEGEPETPEDETPAEPASAAPAPGWQRRIAELTRQNRELRARQGQAPAADGTPSSDTPAAAPAPGTPEFDQLVNARAAQIAEVNAFNARMVKLQTDGISKGNDGKDRYPGWNSHMQTLALLGDDGRVPIDLVDAALEADDPNAVLVALAQDPDQAAALLSMSPAQRLKHVLKMSVTRTAPAPKPPKPQTQAPPPVETVSGGQPPRSGGQPSDSQSGSEWLKAREAQLREKARREAAANRV